MIHSRYSKLQRDYIILQSLECMYGIYIHTKQILYLYWFICNQWIYRIFIFHIDFKLPLLGMEFMDQMKVSLTLMNLLDPTLGLFCWTMDAHGSSILTCVVIPKNVQILDVTKQGIFPPKRPSWTGELSARSTKWLWKYAFPINRWIIIFPSKLPSFWWCFCMVFSPIFFSENPKFWVRMAQGFSGAWSQATLCDGPRWVSWLTKTRRYKGSAWPGPRPEVIGNQGLLWEINGKLIGNQWNYDFSSGKSMENS